MTNRKAMAEIEVVLNTAQTAPAIIAGIESIMRRYRATERIVKVFPNGIKRMLVLDANGQELGTYHA